MTARVEGSLSISVETTAHVLSPCSTTSLLHECVFVTGLPAVNFTTGNLSEVTIRVAVTLIHLLHLGSETLPCKHAVKCQNLRSPALSDTLCNNVAERPMGIDRTHQRSQNVSEPTSCKVSVRPTSHQRRSAMGFCCSKSPWLTGVDVTSRRSCRRSVVECNGHWTVMGKPVRMDA